MTTTATNCNPDDRPYTVAELRGMMKPGQRALADSYVARLPKTALVSKPDFIAALDLHHEVADSMIAEMELDAADWGGRGKAYWYITRDSIVHLIHRRILGIRSSVPRTLRSQARFDFAETTTKKGTA